MFFEYYNRMKDQPKYVILGCQGSGTNLVSRLLQSTLDFSVVHDRSLIFNAAVQVLKHPGDESIELQFQKIRRRVFPGKWRRRFMLKRHYRQAKRFEGLPGTIDTEKIKTAADFANFFYAFHAYTGNAKHQGLKSDDLWESIDNIEKIIPCRRYVLLVRDPRDNALSITNKDFGPRNLFAASEYVRERMQKYKEEIDRQAEADVITITYEHLLNQPQVEMERISEKWSLELTDDYASKINGMNIRSHNQQKWKKLSSRKLAVCQSVLGDMIQEYDYEFIKSDSRNVSSIMKAYWRIGDVAQRIPQRAYKTCRNFLIP